MATTEKLENTETRENSAASSGPLGPDTHFLREEGGDSTAAAEFGLVPSPDAPALALQPWAGCLTSQSWFPPLCNGNNYGPCPWGCCED